MSAPEATKKDAKPDEAKVDTKVEVKAAKAEVTVAGSTASTTKTVRKTIVETIEESNDSLLTKEVYRPTIASKSIIIQRGSYLGATPGGRQGYGAERSVRYSMNSTPALTSSLGLTQLTGMLDTKTSREKEKKDMQDLNERFADYIEKVRFLEAQNKKLADELAKLKSKWGTETNAIKAMYEAELAEARKLLDDANREKGRLELRLASLEEVLEELRERAEAAQKAALAEREKNEKLIQQLSDLEAECNLLRRRFQSIDSDREKDKRSLADFKEKLQLARSQLDNETLLHIDAENRRQTLEEELEFLKALHEQEMKELAALAYRDTTSENRAYWKSEMGQALREIQQIYDDKIEDMRGQMEQHVELKVREVRTGATQQNMEAVHLREDNKRIRGQMGSLQDRLNDLDARNALLARELETLRREKDDIERRLQQQNNDLQEDLVKTRAELEAIYKELAHISDTKLGLELEIAAYRKLLEGEENRVGLRQIVDMITQDQSYTFRQTEATSGDKTKVSQVVKGEMSAKTTYQRSAKGPVAIAEIEVSGKFIQLENTGRKEENLGEWKLKRNIDGEDKIDFGLPKTFVLNPGDKVKIWAKGTKPTDAPSTDLESDVASWLTGNNITTKLVNPANEDRATHIQRTTFA
jgi:intermediate filament protein if